MISTKRRVIIQAVLESKLEYSKIVPVALEKHIQIKYKL